MSLSHTKTRVATLTLLSNFFTVRPCSERCHSSLQCLHMRGCVGGGCHRGVCDTGRYLLLLLYNADFKPGTNICEYNISDCRNQNHTSLMFHLGDYVFSIGLFTEKMSAVNASLHENE